MGNNSSGLKGREVKIMEQVMQIIGERDEGIRGAFGQMNQNVGNSFMSIDYKINVIFTILKGMGITQEHIDEASQVVQNAMNNEGGGNNEAQPTGPIDENQRSNDDREETISEEGDEHFGGN